MWFLTFAKNFCCLSLAVLFYVVFQRVNSAQVDYKQTQDTLDFIPVLHRTLWLLQAAPVAFGVWERLPFTYDAPAQDVSRFGSG